MGDDSLKQLVDESLTNYFIKMEELSSLRRQLDQELKDGFLHMAKARSNMGHKSISSLQYDEREMSATVNVLSTDDSLDVIDRTKEITTLGTQQLHDSDSDEVVKCKDPLLMFGVLVPQSLRSGQTCFQRTIRVIGQLCNVQQEALTLAEQYKMRLSQLLK